MARKNKEEGFREGYTVRFKYQKPDGFWTTAKEDVYVRCVHGEKEKNNHAVAELCILDKFPNAEIISVTYH